VSVNSSPIVDIFRAGGPAVVFRFWKDPPGQYENGWAGIFYPTVQKKTLLTIYDFI